jgi:hypothetical protein
MVFMATAEARKPHFYTPACFKLPGGGNLRHKPMAATFFTSPKTNDRLTQLWEELRADPVPLQPPTKQGRTAGVPVVLRHEELLPFMPTDYPKPENRSWRVDLVKLFHSLLEPEVAESPLPSGVEAISEGDTSPEASMAAAHEASLALSTPFHWDPKPAWIDSPARPNYQFSNTIHPPRFAPRPKIPIRPLHKQPFYQRFFFYLRRWLSRDSGKIA